MRHSPWVRAVALVIALSTLLATGLAFVSLGSGDGDDEVDRVELAPAVSTTLDDDQRALAALLPDGPLDGMTRTDDDLGPLTLTQAAAEYPFGDVDGARLRADGFVRGFARAWAGTDGRSAHVLVYELRDPDAYLRSWAAAAEGLADSRFDTPVGQGISDVEQDTEASIVAWVEGTYWYYVVHFGPAGQDGPDRARAIVEAVRAR
ncbi:MAG: hypothetical protein AB7H43_08395 [Acidimicrobiia bacterium]